MPERRYPQIVDIQPPLSIKNNSKWQLYHVKFQDENSKTWFGDMRRCEIEIKQIQYYMQNISKVPYDMIQKLFDLAYYEGQRDEAETNAGPSL